VTPDSDTDWGQADGEYLDAGDDVTFRRGGAVWELERIEDAGTEWYIADPEDSPEELPATGKRLRFDAPGGADVPPIEVRGAMPIVREFNVTRPGLATGSDTLVLDPTNPFQFAWTPQGDDGVGLLLEFFNESTDEIWEIDCWVEDNGSFAIDPSDLGLMPTNRLGSAAIRRFDTNWEEPTEDNPEMTFTGVFEHRWGLIFESAGPSPGPPPPG